MKDLWLRLSPASRVPLTIGAVFAVVGFFLPTLLTILVAVFAAALVGFLFPAQATRAGILVALPVLIVAYLFGLVRGFSGTLMLIVLLPSFILPVALARMAASVRGVDAT